MEGMDDGMRGEVGNLRLRWWVERGELVGEEGFKIVWGYSNSVIIRFGTNGINFGILIKND